MRSLEGEFSARIHDLLERLIRLRMYVESAIDFPEEEIDFLSDGAVAQRLDGLAAQVAAVLAEARQGCLLREGMQVVIAGRPNVGKSSLLNRLARREAAIVTAIPGTTRDVLRETISIDGLPLHISDTAGLRDSEDPVERLGIQRARAEIASADRVLLLMDDAQGLAGETLAMMEKEVPPEKLTLIHNKIDLSGREPGLEETSHGITVRLSAKTGAGIELLCRHLKETMGYQQHTEGSFMARRRHLDALQRAAEFLTNGQHQLASQQAGELLAEDLRQAQQALGEITGEFSADDLLGQIFASFCIGK